MKYKVGDKVRVRRDLKNSVLYGGLYAVDEMLKKKIVTITSVHDDYYKVGEDDYKWTDEMLEGLVEDELTAEEAIRLRAEMCANNSCNECRSGKRNNGEGINCCEFSQKYPERVIEILKQWKKEHEKKEVKVTQKIQCLVVDEERNVVHEEEIDTSDSCMDVLKNYCENHDGKFFSLMEFRYEVKQ